LDRWLEKDITIRVISVVLALALWFQVTAEQNPLTTRTLKSVTVKAENLDQGLVLIDMAPRTIAVTVQSQRRIVNSLKDEDIQAFVDLKTMESGKASLTIDVTLPWGVQLVEVLPNQVTVTADTMARKKVRIEVRVMGNPAEDFMALPGQPRIVETTVEGPRSRVGLVSRAVADVDVAGASQDAVKNVPLRALDIDGREVKDVSFQPKSVEVRVPMRKLPPAKVVNIKAEIQGPPKEGFKVSAVQADPTTVRIRGPAEVLAKIESVVTNPLDVRGVATDFDRQVEVVLPAGVSLVEPRTVLVRASIVEDRTEKTIAKVPIIVKNVSQAYKWTLIPADIALTVEGRRIAIDKLNPKTVEVWVDALGLFEGEHTLSAQVSLPAGVVLTAISSDTVTLTLKKR